MGVLLMLATILAAGAAIVAAIAAGYFHLPSLTRATQIGVVTWATAYTALLVSTSVTSAERVLAPGDVKRFCGFYLDCHMGVAVERVDTMSRIGVPGDEIQAGGTFYVVTLRVSSDARRVPLRLEQPRAVIVDAEGFRHERSLDAEGKLARAQVAELEQPVNAGDSFTRAIVIDVPHGAPEPRLYVTMGGPLERAVELALIGDEDALLHARTLHALAPGSGVSSASASGR